ncbi:hypothetical protein [Streptomyces sp. KR55]|uniref:hypothetical protein n=1 Tax=Streptomyces sp. KR55 TaxID=3457425 RepID=UPI003FD01613
MQRTQADLNRRRNLADAAAGVIQRARVVLYACTPSGETDRVLDPLRQYAAARDWDVAAELVDAVSVTWPTAVRPQWARLVELIESQQAQGIVTPMRSMCGLGNHEQDELDTWLATHHAFIANVWNNNRPVASAPGA